MIVMKFGGTSVGNAERIHNVAKIVKSRIKENPVVVVSAVTKITDALIALVNECVNSEGNKALGMSDGIINAHCSILEQLNLERSLLSEDIKELTALAAKTKISKRIDGKVMDIFQSFGERMSCKIVAAELNNIGVQAKPYNSWELGFLTNDEHGNAEPLESSYANLKINIKKLKRVPVITGFIGKSQQNEITTLGRGGSDYTAAIIGAAIDAKEIQIWTDVDGIMTSDPKIVKNARTIERISFAEASELAYFGAKVLHPKSILPAMKKNIPVKVLNSFNPKCRGTTILSEAGKNKQDVKAISCKKNITVINVESVRILGAYGFLARLFSIFEKHKKSVDVVSTSEVSVSMSIDSKNNIDALLDELKGIANIKTLKNKAIISVVGEGIKYNPEIAGRTFTALGRRNINVEMISQGASEINITFIVDGKDAEKSVKLLHEEYFGAKR